jgi:hypothetical protein
MLIAAYPEYTLTKWNLPVYLRGGDATLWMLQNFKNHCSLYEASGAGWSDR